MRVQAKLVSLSLIFVNQDKIESVVRFESRSQRTIDSTRLSRELSKTTEQRKICTKVAARSLYDG